MYSKYILRVVFQHCRCLHYVFLVNRADINASILK